MTANRCESDLAYLGRCKCFTIHLQGSRTGNMSGGIVFARQELAFALEAPAVARERAVLLHHTMARDEDGDRVDGTSFRHLAGLTRRAEPCSDVAIARRLPSRYLA